MDAADLGTTPGAPLLQAASLPAVGSTTEMLKETVFGAVWTLHLGGQLDTEWNSLRCLEKRCYTRSPVRPSPTIVLWQQWEILPLILPLLSYVNINQSLRASQLDNPCGDVCGRVLGGIT